MKLKVEGNKVMYFNGKKFLVKETCSSKKKAEQLLKDLEKQNKQNAVDQIS